ncbi:MAG TPA: hypothetical protein VMA95_20265 [Streptosporangiaceae bacterium]|nr:hypothetical protein [Streptosporangiaceae bacterium]
MTDLAQQQAGRPGRATDERSGDSGRAAARAELDAALRGVELTAPERRFLARLSQWDKRTATTVASLVSRARQRGRREGALSARQLDVVMAALADAVEYRTSGAASAGCWDCASRASGLCAEHERDADRAHGFAELAAVLRGQTVAKNGSTPASQEPGLGFSQARSNGRACARVARGCAQEGGAARDGEPELAELAPK